MDQIRNLSVRKTILLYLAVSLVCSFLLSAWIAGAAGRIQQKIWWKYVDCEQYFELVEEGGIPYMITYPRPASSVMTKQDRMMSETCDFLQTYAVLLLSVTGSGGAVFLFYKHKLKVPIEKLEEASRKIAGNNLDFQIVYDHEDEMGRLCREFEKMREQLSKNNRILWRSLEDERALRAAVAHDIRAPLSVLCGYHEMLVESLSEENVNPSQVREMLAESGKQIKRMDAFVETMRKLSSLEKRELRSAEFTAVQLQADIKAEAEIFEQETGRHISVQVLTEDGVFAGDKEVILEVTENLLSNALRYAKEKVETVLSVTDSEVRICVRDDGTGFGESTEEVTRAFHQQNVKDSLKHMGLGMYISRLYCEKHGGKLFVENLDQNGASVTAAFHRIA